MRLKKLEISGFKSFANKTTLEFPTTISAVVGPNGSGKSNVVDAIRWVLGEQGLKNLRSKSGADLIWAGSAIKPSQGKASVSLHFDNGDGFFPVDFDEVVIGRKIYRDGDNEYYLNNSQVRLKDIVELLARSKLGLRGHSIVNQGSADEILKALPKERRGILEEALGLREFQLKKTEAETKLLETGANLDQTANLINEISPHLRSLKRQAEKFQKRESLVGDLNECENKFFGIKIKSILAEKNANQSVREEFREKILMAKNNFEASEKIFEDRIAKFSQTGAESAKMEESLDALNTERQKITRELGRAEGLIESARNNNIGNAKTLEAVLAIKIKYWAKRLDAALALSETGSIRESLKGLADEIKTIRDYFEKGNIAKILALVNLADLEEKTDNPHERDAFDLKRKLFAVEKQIEDAKNILQKIRSEEIEWRNQYSDLQKEMEVARRAYMSIQEAARSVELEEEKINLKEADLKSEMWGSNKNYEEFCDTMLPNFAIADFSNDLENKIIKLRREISEIGNIDEETLREYEETNRRHEFLTKEFSDLERAVGSLKNLIGDLAERIGGDFEVGLIKINEEFDRYFKSMFGGGSAKLAIETAEEKESGVAININMPKKRIRDLNALSGGERSLVSIALLFAIVSASQPPFLVLDEVDAALDEDNAVRFAKVLKNLAEKTQFVLITHNRST
ncbi:TPA: hypothetical protein DIU12_00790, partial [Candidatus Azambacteria bacterium]|nr:hypothetical protein [Candidatus Azambacteria bacterium]